MRTQTGREDETFSFQDILRPCASLPTPPATSPVQDGARVLLLSKTGYTLTARLIEKQGMPEEDRRIWWNCRRIWDIVRKSIKFTLIAFEMFSPWATQLKIFYPKIHILCLFSNPHGAFSAFWKLFGHSKRLSYWKEPLCWLWFWSKQRQNVIFANYSCKSTLKARDACLGLQGKEPESNANNLQSFKRPVHKLGRTNAARERVTGKSVTANKCWACI